MCARRHAAQHHELALGKIHDIGSVVDQGEAKRDESIDRSDGQPGERELEKLGHSANYPGRIRSGITPSEAAGCRLGYCFMTRSRRPKSTRHS